MSDLQIYTSFVSVKNLKRCTSDLNLVPVFAMKKIYNSEIIGIYSETSVHMPNLSPSNELFHGLIEGNITRNEFMDDFVKELDRDLDLNSVIEKFEIMAKVSNASGIVIMTFGRDPRNGYRPELAKYLNDSGLLSKQVYEI